MKKMTFAIKTLGCKVNQYESQVLRENLARLGHAESGAKDADVVIINSCTVTGQADLAELLKAVDGLGYQAKPTE
jgi:threonylcarbamoyladenosine tRNA methylthiotransferase MtaB